MSVQIERSGALSRSVVMNVTTVDRTAIGQLLISFLKCISILLYVFLLTAGRDYFTVSQKIRFARGQSKVIVFISILDDNIATEPDISFFVDFTFDGVTIARSVVTIIDNDHGKLINSV